MRRALLVRERLLLLFHELQQRSQRLLAEVVAAAGNRCRV